MTTMQLDSSQPHAPATAPFLDEDTALMLRFQSGDPSAFAALYQRHYEAVLQVCQRMLDRRSTAADLTHDTFVTAAERRDQWHPQPTPNAVRAWFTTIATRKCLDQIRRASTRRERTGELVIETGVSIDLPDPRCRAILAEAVAELPAEQREVVTMKVEQEMTYREIAEQTGIPEPALKSRFRLARQKLARFLAAAGLTREQLSS